jgi:distribution and morphology protein 31
LKTLPNKKNDIKSFLNTTKKSVQSKQSFEKVTTQHKDFNDDNKKEKNSYDDDNKKEKEKNTYESSSKWVAVRQKGEEWKTWTSDKILAFTSWFVVGTTTWILIGTTTVFSLVLWFANQFDADGYI